MRINENNQENLLPATRSLPTLPAYRPGNYNSDSHGNLHNHRDNHQCPSDKWLHNHHSEPHDQRTRRSFRDIIRHRCSCDNSYRIRVHSRYRNVHWYNTRQKRNNRNRLRRNLQPNHWTVEHTSRLPYRNWNWPANRDQRNRNNPGHLQRRRNLHFHRNLPLLKTRDTRVYRPRPLPTSFFAGNGQTLGSSSDPRQISAFLFRETCVSFSCTVCPARPVHDTRDVPYTGRLYRAQNIQLLRVAKMGCDEPGVAEDGDGRHS